MRPKRIAILYSGGLDSVILHRFAQVSEPDAAITAIFWDHGHKQQEREIASLPSFVQVRKVDWLNLPVAGGYTAKKDANGPIYIPGRNLAFAVLTACQELPDEVWIGALANEAHAYASDKNHGFLRTTGEALSHALKPFLPGGVRVRAPFVEQGWDKEGAVAWALLFGDMPLADLTRTWSCYENHREGKDRTLPCGNCSQCVRRFALWSGLGQPWAEHFAAEPLLPGQGRDWLLRLLAEAQEAGWQGPSAADCRPFLRHLIPHIRQRHAQDSALQAAADLLEGRFS